MSRAKTAKRDAVTFDASRWERSLYDLRREAWAPLADAERALTEAVGADREELDALTGQPLDPAGVTRATGEEVLSRLYGAPGVLERPRSRWAKVAHDVVGQRQLADLRADCFSDPDVSAVVTRRLLEALAEELPAALAEKEQEEKAQQDAQDGSGAPGGFREGPAEGQAQRKAKAALRKAMRAAREEASEVKSALSALGCGAELAPAQHEQVSGRRMALVARVAESPQLRRVLLLAGRIERVHSRQKRVRSRRERSETCGVTLGRDVSRMLPSEAARLSHPVLRLDLLRRMHEGRVMEYDLQGEEPLGRGPIVLMLDESSSMSGEPHEWARAVAVACVLVARTESRPITVVSFNGGVSSVHRLDALGRSFTVACRAISQLTRSPHADVTVRSSVTSSWEDPILSLLGDATTLIEDLVSRKASGGTSFDRAFDCALSIRDGLSEDRADLVLVTDGEATLSPAHLERITEARSRGLRIYAATLNGGSLSETVQAVADHAVDIDTEMTADRAVALVP